LIDWFIPGIIIVIVPRRREPRGASMDEAKRIVAEGYDRIGGAYRAWSDAGGSGVRRWFLSETLARIPPGSDVLELGCGPGVDAVALAEGRRYTGVDLSPVMLSLARKRLPSGAFLRHDLTSVEMREDSFYAVVALYVFGHVPAAEHVPTFSRVFRWLRPGGVFCSSFPSGDDGDAIQEDWLGVPMFFGGMGRDATEAALREIGFRLEISEIKEEVEKDGATVAFLWVIARKPG
jgi:SAM-dependent methyltransferase